MSPTNTLDVSNEVLLERAQTLRKVCIFRNVPHEDRLRLAFRCQHHTYPHGAKIMLQGEAGSHFYIILKGTVHVVVDGCVVRRMVPFSYFGERSLLLHKPISATIIVHSQEAEVWAISKTTFLKAAQERPEIMRELKHRLPLQDMSIKLKDLQTEEVIGS
eukprot:3188156-Amphidinium_carterae.1